MAAAISIFCMAADAGTIFLTVNRLPWFRWPHRIRGGADSL